MKPRTDDDRYRTLAMTAERLTYQLNEALDARNLKAARRLAAERREVWNTMSKLRHPAGTNL